MGYKITKKLKDLLLVCKGDVEEVFEKIESL